MKQFTFRTLIKTQLAAFALATTIAPIANADIVATEQLIQTQEHALPTPHGEIQASLASALQNDEVVRKLVSMGVDPAEAQARVQNLTAAEASLLAAKIEEMPAGGDVVLLLVIVILVLLLR